MSIVGYILGLGDRHPSNLMLDKISGRYVHLATCYETIFKASPNPILLLLCKGFCTLILVIASK